MSKAQVSFEFIIITSILVFITIVFGLFASERLLDIRDRSNFLQLQDLAGTVRNEIEVAHGMEDGYERRFGLPDYVGNSEYSIVLANATVVISFQDEEFAFAVLPVNGSVQKGANRIRKLDGEVILNG